MAYNKSPFKMAGKSPLMKQLIGKQSTLPEGLQAAIKASPVKQKAGYVKHKTLTVKGKPLEYNPKFDPKKLITDQSESGDKKSLKKKSPAKMHKKSPMKQVRVKDLPKKAVDLGEDILEGGKKFIKSIGNIKLSSKAREDCKKAGGKYSRKKGCLMPVKQEAK